MHWKHELYIQIAEVLVVPLKSWLSTHLTVNIFTPISLSLWFLWVPVLRLCSNWTVLKTTQQSNNSQKQAFLRKAQLLALLRDSIPSAMVITLDLNRAVRKTSGAYSPFNCSQMQRKKRKKEKFLFNKF